MSTNVETEKTISYAVPTKGRRVQPTLKSAAQSASSSYVYHVREGDPFICFLSDFGFASGTQNRVLSTGPEKVLEFNETLHIRTRFRGGSQLACDRRKFIPARQTGIQTQGEPGPSKQASDVYSLLYCMLR